MGIQLCWYLNIFACIQRGYNTFIPNSLCSIYSQNYILCNYLTSQWKCLFVYIKNAQESTWLFKLLGGTQVPHAKLLWCKRIFEANRAGLASWLEHLLAIRPRGMPSPFSMSVFPSAMLERATFSVALLRKLSTGPDTHHLTKKHLWRTLCQNDASTLPCY